MEDKEQADKRREQRPGKEKEGGPRKRACIISTDGGLKPNRIRPQRPSDVNYSDLEGPSSLTTYHKQNKWLTRLTIGGDTLEVVEREYPLIRDHLPLRLLLQYLLFNRYAVQLNSAWKGEGAPIPASMLAWMAGRKEQYDSGNFRTADLLWWAVDALFGSDFMWAPWRWLGPNAPENRYRRVTKLVVPTEVEQAVTREMCRSVTDLDHRVWFSTGTRYTKQSAANYRKSMQEAAKHRNDAALTRKGTPEIPGRIRDYLNGLPAHGFTKAVRKYIDDAYRAVESLSGEYGTDDGLARSKQHARACLRHIEDCPQPFYEVKDNTQRLYARSSLQQLNREVRSILVQDWVSLDLKSAHLAICARQWDIVPLLQFLENGNDIWEELMGYTDLPKRVLKDAIYALTYGASVWWTNYGKSQPRLVRTFLDAGYSENEAKEARSTLLTHPLIKSLYTSRKEQIATIEEQGHIEDVFGSVLRIEENDGTGTKSDQNGNASPLTLLTAEAAAVEMLLLWPAFEKVIGKEKRCKIMLYTFDGIYIKTADPRREGTWVRKLQRAVDEQAERLEIPTYLERDD